MPHESSLVHQMLSVDLQGVMLVFASSMVADLLTRMRPMRCRQRLTPRDDLFAVQVVRKPPVFLLFLAFTFSLFAKSSLVFVICLLSGLRPLAIAMAFSPHQPSLKLLESVDVAV